MAGVNTPLSCAERNFNPPLPAPWTAAWLAGAVLLLAGGAHAQGGSSCEQLKGVLAARIPSNIQGYSMETVAGNAPVPRGARISNMDRLPSVWV